MAALEIPGVGEPLGQTQVRIMTFGASGESPTVNIGSGTGTTALFNINEPNVFVEKIESQVVLKISSAGTGAMTIGDSDDVDGYWTDTLLLITTTAAVFNNMATTVAYAQGRLYTATQTIDLIKASAIASVGKVRLRISYFRNADTNIKPATST